VIAPGTAGTLGLTVIVLVLDVTAHDPPVVVKVSVAVPLYAGGGVHVAFKVVAEGIKAPPAGVDHIPPVAPPPTVPLKAAEVPPWQMADITGPIPTLGKASTVTVRVIVDTKHPGE
jgi:hypothetical protein